MTEDTTSKQGRSAAYNIVVLGGRLGADAEMVQITSGTAKMNLRLATNDYWKDKEGVQQERTDWHTVIGWGKLAEAYGMF